MCVHNLEGGGEITIRLWLSRYQLIYDNTYLEYKYARRYIYQLILKKGAQDFEDSTAYIHLLIFALACIPRCMIKSYMIHGFNKQSFCSFVPNELFSQ